MHTDFGNIICNWNQYPDLEEAKHAENLTIMSAECRNLGKPTGMLVRRITFYI